MIALFVSFLAFRGVSLVELGTLFSHVGVGILLIPLPFALAQLTETTAWCATFNALGCKVNYGDLLRVRLGCEGLVQTMPGGTLVAESIKPALLVSECGLTVSDAICGAASRKLLLLVSQCVYFAAAAALGWSALQHVASKTTKHWLAVLVLCAWLVLVAAAYAL